MAEDARHNEHDSFAGDSAADRQGENDNTFLDLMIVVARHKKFIFGIPLAVGIVTALLSLLMTNVYTASAKILPPQQPNNTSMLLGQLGALSGFAAPGFGSRAQNELYVGMLKSRTVADSLIERFELRKVFAAKDDTLTRLALAGQSVINAGTDGIITISVDHTDPKLAADLANGYVDELRKLTQTLAVTESSKRRLFFEQQLKLAKEALANAELALKSTQEKTGLVRLEEQGKAIIEGVARIRAQIAAKEVQLSATRMFATAENPEYLRIQEELAELRTQLGRAEKDRRMEEGSIFVPTGKFAEAGLAYVRVLRDVKYHETVYELLAKQFEIAKIDEAKESSLVQVLDDAIPPQRKSKPKRAQITIAATMLAGFAVVLWIFMKEVLARLVRDPERSRKLDLLRAYLRIRWPLRRTDGSRG